MMESLIVLELQTNEHIVGKRQQESLPRSDIDARIVLFANGHLRVSYTKILAT
jgi:hypothetical protein